MFKKIVDKEEIYNLLLKSFGGEEIRALASFYLQTGDPIIASDEGETFFINSFFPSFPSLAWQRFLSGLHCVRQKKQILYQADIVVTGRCHCSCWHCYRSKHCKDDLPLEHVIESIRQLYQMGVATLGITGGEPMLRNDIHDIIRAVPNGMEAQLYTTGHNVDEDFCRFLCESNVTRVIVSLDHYKEDIVNRMRNNKNAYNETNLAIKNLVRNNIYTAITLCITEDFSEEDIIEYFKYVHKLQVQEIRIVMPIPQGNIEGKDIRKTYQKNRMLISKIKESYIHNPNFPNIVLFSEFESRFYFGCSAGNHYLSINNDGQITPCVAVPLSFGNIYDNSLCEVFKNMQKYFKCNGSTCYGRKIAKIMNEISIDTTKTPLDVNISKVLAEKCIVENQTTLFFSKYLK